PRRRLMAVAAGLSEHPLPTQATGEVIGQVLEALGPTADPPDLAMLFATGPHVGAVEDIATAVRATLNPRTLLGCTAESIVGGGREVEQRPAVALWAGHTGRVTPFHARVAPTPDGNAVVGWPDLDAASETSAVLVLADPFTFPADEVLRRVSEDRPGLPIVGGLASAAVAPGGNRLAIDDHVVSEGAVGAVLGPGADVVAVVSQGCRPVGDLVDVGSTSQFQVRDAASADEELHRMLDGRLADGALLFTCNGRGTRLFGRPDHDAEIVAEHVPRAAVAGMFCAGELGPVGRKNFLHGFTASVVLFGGCDA